MSATFNTLRKQLGYLDVRDYGGVNDGGTTENGAALTAAIDACVARGGGTILLQGAASNSGSEYVVSRAPQNSGVQNAQIPLPIIDSEDPQITVRLLGPVPCVTSGVGAVPRRGRAVIKSTLTGQSGSAALMASGQSGRNNFHLVLENVQFEMPDNPTLSCLNLGWQQDVIIRNVLIHCQSFEITTAVEPTHSNAIGVILPQNNNPAYTDVSTLAITGMYTALRMGECGAVRGFIAASCIRGIEFPGAHHANQIFNARILECPYGLVALHTGTPTTSRLQFFLLDIENANGQFEEWQDRIDNITDENNDLLGFVNWTAIDSGPGVTHTLKVNGTDNDAGEATGLTRVEVD